ncbi:hypothetical protein DVH05_004995 [Phytophthora capsici]|nr:hypothetical protein DVH05_004995 [Phytophthora capsici]
MLDSDPIVYNSKVESGILIERTRTAKLSRKIQPRFSCASRVQPIGPDESTPSAITVRRKPKPTPKVSSALLRASRWPWCGQAQQAQGGRADGERDRGPHEGSSRSGQKSTNKKQHKKQKKHNSATVESASESQEVPSETYPE